MEHNAELLAELDEVIKAKQMLGEETGGSSPVLVVIQLIRSLLFLAVMFSAVIVDKVKKNVSY